MVGIAAGKRNLAKAGPGRIRQVVDHQNFVPSGVRRETGWNSLLPQQRRTCAPSGSTAAAHIPELGGFVQAGIDRRSVGEASL